MPEKEGSNIVLGVLGFASKAINRLCIWGVGVGISAFPALSEAHAHISLDIDAIADQVNNAGDFRDLYFVLVTVVIVAMTNLIDNCLRRLHKINKFLGNLVVPVVLFYILILVYGVSQFRDLAGVHSSLNPSELHNDFRAMKGVLIATLMTEVFIAATYARRNNSELCNLFDLRSGYQGKKQ